jgi:four helix bundle protein
VAVYELAKRLPKEEEFGLKSQLRRAAVSVPSNISEGLTRKTKNYKIHFLNMAQGSVSEIDTQLFVCVKLKYFENSDYDEARENIVEIEKLLSGLINKLGG